MEPEAKRFLAAHFAGRPRALTEHHLASHDDFLLRRLPLFFQANNPVEHEAGPGRVIRIWLGGRDGAGIRFLEPETLPHEARLRNLTYGVTLEMTLDLDFEFGAGHPAQSKQIREFAFAFLPIPVFSHFCLLKGKAPGAGGECLYDPGGYFIVAGQERVLLGQESLGANLLHTQVGHDPVRAFAEVRAGSEDGKVRPFGNRVSVMKDAQILVSIPDVDEPVPLAVVFRALGVPTEREMAAYVLGDMTAAERRYYEAPLQDALLQRPEPHLWNQVAALEFLKKRTRRQTQFEVLHVLRHVFLAHVGPDPLRKAFVLADMARKALAVAVGRAPPSDRDHLRFKRLDVTGDLCFNLFTRTFAAQKAAFLSRLDAQLTFNAEKYKGAGLRDIIVPENLDYLWEPHQYRAEFDRAFKGKWLGQDAVSQPLWRTQNPGSYAGSMSMLRKCALTVPEDLAGREIRSLHGSQWGYYCINETPDGGNIGLLKNLSLMTKVSTAVSRETLLAAVRAVPGFVPLEELAATDVRVTDCRIWVNGAWLGIHRDPPALHRSLLKARRDGRLPDSVSLAWKIQDNELFVAGDAGRLVRPLHYDAAGHVEFVDADESETLLIAASAAEFDPDKHTHAEIHPLFLLSASSALVPFFEHNPTTRNMFVVQQLKQAIGLYHTNWPLRFDTAAAVLFNPQFPIVRTELLRYMPLQYGENVLVAVQCTTGHNQEDSLIANHAALLRGRFRTLYLSTVETAEQILDFATNERRTIANPLKVPDALPSALYDYGRLDADGVVLVGSRVQKGVTVLVGAVRTVPGQKGVDASLVADADGVVDNVFRARDPATGLAFVKVRLREERIPRVGDKFASRQGQKGELARVEAEENMPFTADGVVPDFVFNPHGVPTRMTAALFLEAVAALTGVSFGCPVDSTPFVAREKPVHTTFERMLQKAGFDPKGRVTMYDGRTGRQIETAIFLGPIYYQRTKQMVLDKIHARDTGSVKISTRQPTAGRAHDGGLRLGEMERDALLAYSVANLLTSEMTTCSDGAEFPVSRSKGEITSLAPDDDTVRVTMPYAAKLALQEFAGVHIKTRLDVELQ